MCASESNRQILITGASSGIGRAITLRLLDRGDRVVGIGRDFAKFPDGYPGFTAHTLDLADLDALPSALRELTSRHPEIDAAILCAGQGLFGGLEELSFESMRALVDLNFTSQAFVVRALIPAMKRRRRGDIVILGSEAALQGRREGTVYCASKFALRGFAQALREEVSRAGIRVCVIEPGMVRTPFFDRLDFVPGDEPANAIEADDVARIVASVLDIRAETVVDEVVLSPLKKVVRRRGDRADD